MSRAHVLVWKSSLLFGVLQGAGRDLDSGAWKMELSVGNWNWHSYWEGEFWVAESLHELFSAA